MLMTVLCVIVKRLSFDRKSMTLDNTLCGIFTMDIVKLKDFCTFALFLADTELKVLSNQGAHKSCTPKRLKILLQHGNLFLIDSACCLPPFSFSLGPDRWSSPFLFLFDSCALCALPLFFFQSLKALVRVSSA